MSQQRFSSTLNILNKHRKRPVHIPLIPVLVLVFTAQAEGILFCLIAFSCRCNMLELACVPENTCATQRSGAFVALICVSGQGDSV
jgi:hypothetical protein